MAKKSNVRVFKEYRMGQIVLLPVDLEEEIEPNHLVRVVKAAIEQMDLSMVYAQYGGGGTSSYHPKMLLKVLNYAYSQQIYSLRKIAKALRENIYFMWLSGNSHPDFHTVNRFRGVVVKETIAEIFAAVLRILGEGGYVKLEAKASKYSCVWAKNTKGYQEQVKAKVSELLEEIEGLNAAEEGAYGEGDLPERGGTKTLDAAQLEQRINELNERLRQMGKAEVPTSPTSEVESSSQARVADGVQSEPVAELGETEPHQEAKARRKGTKGRLRHKSKAQQLAEGIQKLAEEYLPRLQKYEAQEAILDGRNSYAKTDHDAPFMRMKEDHLKNGQWWGSVFTNVLAIRAA